MREYQARWMAKRRAAWLAENGPCVRCGSWDELEVDHRDPDAKSSHRIWSLSDERRAAELAKCQVLCRPCHQRKTAAQACVLTDAQIAEARRLMEKGLSYRAAAKRFGVSHKTTFKIKKGLIRELSLFGGAA